MFLLHFSFRRFSPVSLQSLKMGRQRHEKGMACQDLILSRSEGINHELMQVVIMGDQVR